MAKIRIAAAPGRRLRDPRTRRLVPAGPFEVEESDILWARRLAHGDAVRAEPPSEDPADGGASDALPPRIAPAHK